jgi:hypothetical protein
MKRRQIERPFLEQLEKVPNISLACEKLGVSRNTVYRWCNEDYQFKKRIDEAMVNGVESINDLAESKLIANINMGNLKAIQYWLDNNKKTYVKPRAKDYWDVDKGPRPITEIHLHELTPEKIKEIKEGKNLE